MFIAYLYIDRLIGYLDMPKLLIFLIFSLQILVGFITGITTLIQMKHHPITIKLYNDSFLYVDNYNSSLT